MADFNGIGKTLITHVVTMAVTALLLSLLKANGNDVRIDRLEKDVADLKEEQASDRKQISELTTQGAVIMQRLGSLETKVNDIWTVIVRPRPVGR
jgi:hypothetical protein